MRIDVHGHYNPARLSEAGAKVWPEHLPVHADSLDGRIELMDELGIDLQLLWPFVQPNFPDLAKSRDFARLTNDIYRDVATQHPGRFSAWGCIPLPHVDVAMAELEYCLDEAKFAGIGFGCSAAGIPLDAPGFEPIWRELNRRKAAVFLHPGQVRSNMPGATDFGLTICVSSPMEMAVAGARLVLSGLTQRYPDVKIILASSGGALPYIHENIQFAAKIFGGDALANVSVRDRLAELYYDTSMSRDPKKLPRLCELCGSSHIVFGTDAPHVDMAQNIAMIHEYFKESEALAILDRNASAILSIHR